MSKKTKLKLKEMIYVDDTLVNSILSQFDKGLVETVAQTNEAISGKTLTNSETKGHNEGIDVKVAKGQHSKSITDINQQHEQNTLSSTVNTIFYDYAVEKLKDRLSKANLLKVSSGGEISEGSFVEISSQADFINLGELQSFLSNKKFSDSMNEQFGNDTVLKSNGISADDLINYMSMASEIFGKITMIKIKNNLIITKPECFRINDSQLQFFKNKNRKLTVLGIVESTFKKSSINYDNIGSILSSFKLDVLRELNILKDNTNFILPIALYFK